MLVGGSGGRLGRRDPGLLGRRLGGGGMNKREKTRRGERSDKR
jgi:hypothetical protein